VSLKLIDNIEPFNDLFYKSCFYNSLFPIIKYYNKDILPIFLNDITIYKGINRNGNSLLYMNYLAVEKLEVVVGELGINMEMHTFTDDIIGRIVMSVNENRPSIVCTDCYYNPQRKDTYQKEHWIHTLLAFGYDEEANHVNILDHNNKESLAYMKRIISYDDMNIGYKGYLENFKNNNHFKGFIEREEKPSYFEFNINDQYEAVDEQNSKLEFYKTDYIQNIKIKIDEIFEGLELVLEFGKNLKEIIYEERELIVKADNLLKQLNSIINAKQIDLFKVSRLFGAQNNLSLLLNEITQSWSLIRGIIAKYKYSSIYKKENFVTVNDRIQSIYELENNFYNYIKSL
jgi:hypothetical protein